jgi:lysosomal acid lipase/cholesteryl ester hydrolase
MLVLWKRQKDLKRWLNIGKISTLFVFLQILIFLFKRKHYNCEQHLVRTKDDYLLCVHRIPSLKHENQQRPSSKKPMKPSKGIEIIDNLDQFIQENTASFTHYTGKPVVLLYHGFLMSSEVWVSNIDEYSNLPFILARQGYDVWLGNARGNKYSQYHVHLSPKHQPFWNFSMNELAMRDLPDTVDVRFSFSIFI